MENVATYSEARSEYTKQLATFIVPTILAWFQQLWSRNASDKQRCMGLFQNECEEIPRWNTDRVHDEVRVLIEKTGCDYMEELMTAVFIAHTKVLTAVRLSKKQQELSITVPKLDHFIHRVFRECARGFWKAPFLFQTEGGFVERQKNVLQIEALATEAITTAVRSLLPVKQILQNYLAADTEEIEDDVIGSVAEEGETQKEEEGEKEGGEKGEGEKEAGNKEEEGEKEPVKSILKSTTEATPVSSEAEGPAVVKIDTEPAAVRFSDYDSVFPHTTGEAEMAYAPKDEDEEDGPSDMLVIKEDSAKELDMDDAEDLEAPAPAPKKAPVISETVEDSDFVVLE